VSRRTRITLALAALAAAPVALAAHGGLGTAPTYYQHVKPILDGRCAGCHYEGGIAPFSLTTYRQARANRLAIADAVKRRIMPPWHAGRGGRRYLYDPSLTDAQIATIANWAAGGAKAGNRSRPAPALPSVQPRISRVDLRLAMPTAYTPRKRATADDYRCFVLDWTPEREVFVTGANVVPGRRTEVHHIILYVAPPQDAGVVGAWDAADPEPGYACYGGPSATGASTRSVQPLSGWVPGSSGNDFPAGSGVRLRPGSRLILQVHYNLANAAPRPDRSVAELSLADAVDRRALYVPVVNPLWLLDPASFRVPAGARRVTHTFSADPRPFVRFLVPDLDTSRGLAVHNVLLHMHRLGRRGQVAVDRADGRRKVLLTVPRWDFNWQREYRLAEPVALEPGDRLSIRCEHTNTTRRLVTWGEDSSDEMCVGFVYVTER
jgi:hypothetical protein